MDWVFLDGDRFVNRFMASLVGLLLFQFSQTAVADNMERGKSLFKLCSTCHGAQAEGTKKLAAPALAGLPQWYIARQLTPFKHDVRGKEFKDVAGMRMRPMARTLSEQDIVAISEYIGSKFAEPHSLKEKPVVIGNAENGKTLYATCMACHGPAGKGNKDMGAPPLVGMNDWYMMTQIKNFKTGIRGANAEKDPQGAMMAPMAQTLADDQAIKDVISYIKTL